MNIANDKPNSLANGDIKHAFIYHLVQRDSRHT
jgi:hypothetical protein